MVKAKKTRKRVISIVLATILCFASSLTAFASSQTQYVDDISVASESDASTYSFGTCIAYDGMIANGYGCEFAVTLDKSYSDIYVRAGATGNSNNAVDCYVTFPDGMTYRLGFVVADGSKTSYLFYTGTAPAGDYIFSFDGTDSGTTGFLGFIYSSN